jgi:IclR family pca regulon transcriptional regulator
MRLDIQNADDGGSADRRPYSLSVVRGLAILACFTPERPALGIHEVADALGMGRSTAHRYIVTLFALNYLEQLRDRRYRLAPHAGDIGAAALDCTGLRGLTYPPLRRLRKQTGYTVGLAILPGTDVLYVARAHGHHRGQYEVDKGQRTGTWQPAYCTASGKLLLAYREASLRRRLVNELKLTARTPKTITSRRVLLDELEQIRADRFAVSDEELTPGLLTLAAPIQLKDGEVIAAIDMAIPVADRPRQLDALRQKLVDMAGRQSATLERARDVLFGHRDAAG